MGQGGSATATAEIGTGERTAQAGAAVPHSGSTGLRYRKADPASVSGARHAVRQLLAALPRDTRELAELMLSELLTNAILATLKWAEEEQQEPPEVAYSVTVLHRHLFIEAHDRVPGEFLPNPHQPVPIDAENGRGLWLAVQLAERLYAYPTATGKLVGVMLVIPGA